MDKLQMVAGVTVNGRPIMVPVREDKPRTMAQVRGASMVDQWVAAFNFSFTDNDAA